MIFNRKKKKELSLENQPTREWPTFTEIYTDIWNYLKSKGQKRTTSRP